MPTKEIGTIIWRCKKNSDFLFINSQINQH